MIPVRAYFRLLVRYLRPMRVRTGLLGLVLLVAISLQLINPQLMRTFIDRATTGSNVGDLVPVAVAFMVIAVAHQVLAERALRGQQQDRHRQHQHQQRPRDQAGGELHRLRTPRSVPLNR